MTDRRPALKFLAFAVVCAVSAAWLIQVTGNFRFFATSHSYQAVLPDATGLFHSDSVHLAGVRVGRVTDIELERGQAIVTFNVDRDIELADTWETGVRWRNVIGQRYLYLYPVTGGEPLEPGDRLGPERARPGADIALFFERITPLMRAIDPEQQNIVLAALNEALAGKEERTQQLIADLGSLTHTLADREDEIRTVIAQGSALLESYARRDAEIRAFLDDFAAVSATLADRNDELVGAVTDIAEVQQRLADMLAANDRQIRQLTTELDTITASIGANRDDFEATIGTLRDGLGVYMLISRWGQWFNVRAVAISTHDAEGNVATCSTEAGGTCDPRNSGPHPGAQATGAPSGPPTGQTVRLAPEPVDGLEAVTSSALQGRRGPVAASRGERG